MFANKEQSTGPKSIALDVFAVTKFLPHRDVMALLDGIDDYWPEERQLVARKHVAQNEFALQGFLPSAPCFPPTLVVEALAQACGIMMNMEGLARDGGDVWRFADREYRDSLPHPPLSVLAESQVKHQRYAMAGDTLKLSAKVAMQRKEFHYFDVSAEVNGQALCSGRILLSYPTYM